MSARPNPVAAGHAFEAEIERIGAGTYRRRDLDIDAINAELLSAMRGQPSNVALPQAQASRYRMLEVCASDSHG